MTATRTATQQRWAMTLAVLCASFITAALVVTVIYLRGPQ